ncbi:MAG: hypothetical protein VXY56_07755, partial [Pseudomonadota bacterium]|nr:hypothetical protein [Pseudomonadota bacterium]
MSMNECDGWCENETNENACMKYKVCMASPTPTPTLTPTTVNVPPPTTWKPTDPVIAVATTPPNPDTTYGTQYPGPWPVSQTVMKRLIGANLETLFTGSNIFDRWMDPWTSGTPEAIAMPCITNSADYLNPLKDPTTTQLQTMYNRYSSQTGRTYELLDGDSSDAGTGGAVLGLLRNGSCLVGSFMGNSNDEQTGGAMWVVGSSDDTQGYLDCSVMEAPDECPTKQCKYRSTPYQSG